MPSNACKSMAGDPKYSKGLTETMIQDMKELSILLEMKYCFSRLLKFISGNEQISLPATFHASRKKIKSGPKNRYGNDTLKLQGSSLIKSNRKT